MGVLLVVLPMHIEDIQSRFAVRNWCIISVAGGPQEAWMSLANPTVADAAGPKLTALPIEQAVALLRRSGCQSMTVEALRSDIAAGAPVNLDGTLNLVAYGAWLVQALAEREAAHGG